MSFNTLSRRMDYIGDGTTKVFPFTFKIFDQTQLQVIRAQAAADLVQSLGTDFVVSGVGLNGGGTVTFTTAPLVTDRVVILGAQPLSQTTSIRNQDAYYPAVIEDALDMGRMVDQQQAEQIGRALSLPVTTKGFSPTLPRLSTADATKLVRINLAGTGFDLIDTTSLLSGSGGGVASGKLNLPTDGTYGGSSGNPAKVAVGDLYEDAFDKVATLLGKMVPTPPNNLSALTLALTQSYQALAAGSGATHLVTDQAQPTVTPGLAAVFANAFADADSGTLSALIDAAQVGLITLTTGDESGATNGTLTILADFDPYAGQSGKSGLYKALTAKVTPTLSVGAHTAQLVHSLTGSTAIFQFYVDDPGTAVLSNLGILPSGATSSKSGVPSYAAGATLAVRFAAAGIVQSHYSSGPLVSVTSSASSGAVQKSPTTPPAAYSTYNDNAALTVSGSVYGESVTATVNAFNSKQVGMTTPGQVSAPIRVDTLGAEVRVTSSTGQFPASGYGQAYDSTQSLAANKELQYLAGAYRYPPAVSYANSLPVGPDYSSLTPDSYASMRWVTFQFGTITAQTSVSFTLQSGQNFGGSALVSGIVLLVRVDGAAPTSGWVDGNAAYPGVGSPTANGDPALDVSSSTALSKRITFGATVRTGTVFVRIGIPAGSNKYFGGIA